MPWEDFKYHIFFSYIINETALTVFDLLGLSELLVSFTGELAWQGHSWGLTSIGHHDFLDRSILGLRCRVGEAGEKKCSLHSQQAEATLDRNVPQHPRRKKKRKQLG